MNGDARSEARKRVLRRRSPEELIEQLDQALAENRRLRGWADNAKQIIGILAVVALLLGLAHCGTPVDFGMPGSDHGHDIVGPFQ